jgi:hypothetical protein
MSHIGITGLSCLAGVGAIRHCISAAEELDVALRMVAEEFGDYGIEDVGGTPGCRNCFR